MSRVRREVKKIILEEMQDRDDCCFYISTLCDIFDGSTYRIQWYEFWFEVNSRGLDFMWEYFEKALDKHDSSKRSFLRMLLVHDFINYLELKEGDSNGRL